MPLRKYYFRTVDGKPIGPFNLNAVAEMIRAQKVKASSPVSLDGVNFQPTKSLPELAILLSVDVEEEPLDSEFDGILDEERLPAYSGQITDVSIPKLFYHFIAARASGRLELTRNGLLKNVFLSNGKIVGASSNLRKEQLSQFLVKAGVLEPQRAREVARLAKERNQRMDKVVLEEKLVEPVRLFELMQQQLRERVLELFTWRTGNYAFYNEEKYSGPPMPMNQDPWELVVEGVRTGYKLVELEKLFQPFYNYQLAIRQNQFLAPSKLPLKPLEQRVFRQAEARGDIHTLLHRFGTDDERRRVLLYTIYMGLELELLGMEQPAAEVYSDTEAEKDWEEQLGPSVEANAAPSGQNGQSPIKTEPLVDNAERRLLEELNELKEKDFFQRLGLDRTAGSSEVNKAFLKAARKYHPDNLPPDASDRVRELSSEIFALLNEAHQKLSDDESRKKYLEALESGLEGDQVDVSNILEAEALFNRGCNLLNARKYGAAFKAFEEATKLNPEEGEFHIYRGWAMFMSKSDRDSVFTRNCQETILRGLKMRGDNVAAGFYFLGMIEKISGNPDKARKLFKKCLSIDREFIDAQRELRLMEKRQPKKSGFFKLKK